MKRVWPLTVALALSACGGQEDDEAVLPLPEEVTSTDTAASDQPKSTLDPNDATISYNFRQAGEDAIRSKLRDPESAVFSDVRMSVKGGPAVLCGLVNSRNGFGGMTGPQRFLTNSDLAVLEEDMETGAMDEVWALYC